MNSLGSCQASMTNIQRPEAENSFLSLGKNSAFTQLKESKLCPHPREWSERLETLKFQGHQGSGSQNTSEQVPPPNHTKKSGYPTFAWIPPVMGSTLPPKQIIPLLDNSNCKELSPDIKWGRVPLCCFDPAWLPVDQQKESVPFSTGQPFSCLKAAAVPPESLLPQTLHQADCLPLEPLQFILPEMWCPEWMWPDSEPWHRTQQDC